MEFNHPDGTFAPPAPPPVMPGSVMPPPPVASPQPDRSDRKRKMKSSADPRQAPGPRNQTRLVTVSLDSLSDAHVVVGRKTKDGGTPMALVPRKKRLSPALSVPEGFYALLYKSGRFMDVVSPGLHFLPLWYRVQYLISKHYTVFDTPVSQVPTNDNVQIEIDTLIVFHIPDKMVQDGGGEVHAAKAFMTKLGPEKLCTVLRKDVEEAVRALGRSVEVNKAYDLSGRSTAKLLKSMNEKFEPLGVEVVSVTITDVRIPETYARVNEDSSTLASREIHRIQSQDFKMLQQRHEKQLESFQKELKNMAIAADQQSTIARVIADREIELVNAAKNAQVTETEGFLTATVTKLMAEAQQTAAQFDAKRENLVHTLQAQVDAEIAKINEEKEAYARSAHAKADLVIAEKRANLIAMEAKAEEKMSRMLLAKRQNELDLKRLDVLKKLVSSDNLLVAGQDGQVNRLQMPFFPEVTSLAYEKAMMDAAFKNIQGNGKQSAGQDERLLMNVRMDTMMGLSHTRKY